MAAYHEPPAKLRYAPLKWLNSFLCRSVDAVHVSSDHIKDRVCTEYGAADQKVHVVPLGPTTDEDNPQSEQTRDDGVLTLLSVGRLSVDKGQLELVRVFDEVRDRFKKPTRLILVGGDGGSRDEIEQYVRQHGIEQSVEMRGFVSDKELYGLYRQADVFVLLTRIESFGLVFAEAQSYGVPIVGYGIDAIKAVFDKGSVLVEPFDLRAVGTVLERIVNDDEYRHALGSEALEHSRRFSWKQTADHIVELYRPATKGI